MAADVLRGPRVETSRRRGTSRAGVGRSGSGGHERRAGPAVGSGRSLAPASSLAAASPPDMVVDVKIAGNKSLPLEKILPSIRTRAGRPFDLATDRGRRSPARSHASVRQRQDLLAESARRPHRDLRGRGASAAAGRDVHRLQRDSQEEAAEGIRLEDGRSGRSERHRGGPPQARRTLPQTRLQQRERHAAWKATSRKTAAPSS